MRLTRRFRHTASLTLALVLAAAGCTDSLGPGRDVTLFITSLTVPSEINVGDNLRISVTAQTTECQSLQGLAVVRTTGRATITARGRDASGSGVVCTDDIRQETTQTVLSGPFEDPFTVVGLQPDGSSITRVVRIR